MVASRTTPHPRRLRVVSWTWESLKNPSQFLSVSLMYLPKKLHSSSLVSLWMFASMSSRAAQLRMHSRWRSICLRNFVVPSTSMHLIMRCMWRRRVVTPKLITLPSKIVKRCTKREATVSPLYTWPTLKCHHPPWIIRYSIIVIYNLASQNIVSQFRYGWCRREVRKKKE